MAEREKVIYSIERCICHVLDACRDCAYDAGHPYNECVEMLLRDVLELLKAQEPVHVKYIKAAYGKWLLSVCGNCGEQIREDWKCCPVCGKAVKWDGTVE